MKDVAALAGVSLATVSRVVNGSVDVRPDLVARVRDAVEVLGYRRDLTASTLRRSDRTSASIGIVIEDIANPFFSAMLRGIEDVARTRGVLSFAASSDEDPVRERHQEHRRHHLHSGLGLDDFEPGPDGVRRRVRRP